MTFFVSDPVPHPDPGGFGGEGAPGGLGIFLSGNLRSLFLLKPRVAIVSSNCVRTNAAGSGDSSL